MDFLNYTKYPPSLDFLLFTLGIALLLLARFEGRDGPLLRAIGEIGGAPMFFYILHLYVLLVLQRIAVVDARRQPRLALGRRRGLLDLGRRRRACDAAVFPDARLRPLQAPHHARAG